MRVLKAFSTPLRRLTVGMDITADDLDGPLTLADWQASGHIDAPAKTAKPPAAPTDAAPREGN